MRIASHSFAIADDCYLDAHTIYVMPLWTYEGTAPVRRNAICLIVLLHLVLMRNCLSDSARLDGHL